MNVIYIFLIEVLFGVLATMIFEFILKNNKNFHKKYYEYHKLFWGYHIHHSTYGLLSIIFSASVFLLDQKRIDMFFLAFGIGIIIQHTLSDGRFIFIEKQRQ
jgi:hypothetical protein